MFFTAIIAAVLLEFSKGGISLEVSAENPEINPGKATIVTLTLKTDPTSNLTPPDLRDRVKGFSKAEDFEDEPFIDNDGKRVIVTTWELTPKPCEEEYKIKPLVIGEYFTEVIYFKNPPSREAVVGEMEIDPKKDLPPLSWKLVGWVALAAVVLIGTVAGLYFAFKYLNRKIREHRMSPIERAWAELDRLLKKGLPGRGRYKDFYVELTLVVRRYVQRKYGIKAPHMTTFEFFAEIEKLSKDKIILAESLKEFLESADMVKFAGVKATPEMADDATRSAKSYLELDDKGGALK